MSINDRLGCLVIASSIEDTGVTLEPLTDDYIEDLLNIARDEVRDKEEADGDGDGGTGMMDEEEFMDALGKHMF